MNVCKELNKVLDKCTDSSKLFRKMTESQIRGFVGYKTPIGNKLTWMRLFRYVCKDRLNYSKDFYDEVHINALVEEADETGIQLSELLQRDIMLKKQAEDEVNSFVREALGVHRLIDYMLTQEMLCFEDLANVAP